MGKRNRRWRNQRKKSVKSYACVLMLMVWLLVAIAVSTMNLVLISNIGRIKTVNVGVYEDFDCTVPLSYIDWGMLEPSDVRNEIAYIQNEANVPIILTLTTQDWVPSNASDFISLTWDYDGSEIAVDAVVEVVFSLTVSPDISAIESFSFDIIIVGEG